MDDQEIIETHLAANVIGVTPAYVRDLADAGRLRVALKTASGQRLFRRSDVLKFAAERDAKAHARERVA